MTDTINIKFFHAINAYAGQNTTIDNIAINLAEYLPILFILCLLYLWFKKDDTSKNIALLAGYSVVLGVLLNFLITAFYFHPRPFTLKIGTLLIPHAPEASFPSDHTTFMLSIAIMLIFNKESRLTGIIFLLLSTAGGIARIFCGLHFPVDVIGSFFVSLIACLIVSSLKYKLSYVNNYIITTYQKIVS